MEKQDSLLQRLNDHGFAIYRNIDEAHFLEKIINTLGTPIAQYDGGLIWDVHQDENKQKAFNTKSNGPIGPHTEFFEFAGSPPRYLVLQCVTPAQCGGGATLLADSRNILAHLSQAEVNSLRNLSFEYYSTELDTDGHPKHIALHSPLEITKEGDYTIFRFSTKYMGGAAFAKISVLHERIVGLFYKVAYRVVWSSGDVVIWDNHRFLHAREAYTDVRRHLRRVIIA